jgi:hypothetical protein
MEARYAALSSKLVDILDWPESPAKLAVREIKDEVRAALEKSERWMNILEKLPVAVTPHSCDY